MEWNDFVTNVQGWARERGIYEHSSAFAQLGKSVEEFSELYLSFVKKDKAGLKDGVGDVAVTLVNVATMLNIRLNKEDRMWINGRTSRLIYSLHVSLGRLLDGATKLGDVSTAALEAALGTSAYALQGIAHNEGLSFGRCLQVAWDAIKDRKGRMVEGGVFVKEEASVEQRLAEPKAETAKLEERLEAIGAVGVTLTHVQQLMNRKE